MTVYEKFIQATQWQQKRKQGHSGSQKAVWRLRAVKHRSVMRFVSISPPFRSSEFGVIWRRWNTAAVDAQRSVVTSLRVITCNRYRPATLHGDRCLRSRSAGTTSLWIELLVTATYGVFVSKGAKPSGRAPRRRTPLPVAAGTGLAACAGVASNFTTLPNWLQVASVIIFGLLTAALAWAQPTRNIKKKFQSSASCPPVTGYLATWLLGHLATWPLDDPGYPALGTKIK